MSEPLLPAVKTVFIVDDHPLVREWLTTLISQEPDLVVIGEAESAPKALEQIERLLPHVIIADITLASGSGLELVKDIRLLSPESRIIMLSMHDEQTYAERALRAGARGYVSKRDSTRKMIPAIRQVLEGKLFLSEEMKEMMTEKFLGGSGGVTSLEELSDRELEVFRMLGQGMDTRDIADQLHISIKTVQVYCARIKEKFNLGTHTDLLRESMRWCDAGLIK
jgi:DNA-binding NarL/FixJ family response regulator